MIYRHEGARKPDARPETCPSCGEAGCVCLHGSYSRGITRWLRQMRRPVARKMLIDRVRCKRCGKTHALLPTEVIPYTVLCVELCLQIAIALRKSRKVSRVAADSFRASVTTCRGLLRDAERLAEALGCALDALDEALADASRDACAFAARFAATHGTAPFSHVRVVVDESCLCVEPPHT